MSRADDALVAMSDVFEATDDIGIEVPERAPRIKQAKPPVPKIRQIAQLWAPIPPRALQDARVTNSHLRMLAAIGTHASYWSVFYPRLERLAAVANRGRTWAYERMRDLERWGYVRRLKSFSRKKRRAITRQIRWTADWPKPPKFAEAELDPTLRTKPWMFPNSIDEGEYMEPLLKELQKPLDENELARRAKDGVLLDRSRTEATTRLCRFFADSVGGATGAAPRPNFSYNTVRGWLNSGFTEKEIHAHIDVLMSEMRGREAWAYPYSLADYRPPVTRVKRDNDLPDEKEMKP